MALLNETQEQKPVAQETGKTSDSKKEAAKRYSEKKKQQAAERKAGAIKLIETLKKNGTYDRLEAAEKNYLVSLTQETNPIISGNSFDKVFGANPAVGKTITLMDCATQHGFGLQAMAAYVKKWLAKGINVEIVPAAKPLETKYVYKGLVQ